MGSTITELQTKLEEAQAEIDRLTLVLQGNEDELRRSREALERARQDLAEFASAASHDLQAPLATISIHAELLLEENRENLSEDSLHSLNGIQESARKLIRLIRDSIDFARLGLREPPAEPVPAAELIKKAEAGLADLIHESGAVIRHEADLPVISVRRTLMERLFTNLIENAVKFARPGVRPEITITVKPGEKEWLFCVKDNGIGMKTDDLGKIFRMFHRLHHESEYPGNGNGLAISRKVVELHGGRIWAESAPGKGASFYFTIAAS